MNMKSKLNFDDPLSQKNENPDIENNSNQKNKTVPKNLKLLHLMFATLNIQSYQEHVPLQIMDFAHRTFIKINLCLHTNHWL